MSRHVLTSSTQPEMWSIQIVVGMRTAEKCTKMKNARAGRTELLFLLIGAIVLWRSRSRRRRRPCVSSLSSNLVTSRRSEDENGIVMFPNVKRTCKTSGAFIFVL